MRILNTAKCVKSKINDTIFVEKGYKYVICTSCYIKIFVDIFKRYTKVRNFHVIKTLTTRIDRFCKICRKSLLVFNECANCEECITGIHEIGDVFIEDNGIVDLVNRP